MSSLMHRVTVDIDDCTTCAGTALITIQDWMTGRDATVTCPACAGTGEANTSPLDPQSPDATRPADIDACTTCKGYGALLPNPRDPASVIDCPACAGSRERGAA